MVGPEETVLVNKISGWIVPQIPRKPEKAELF
jgi:hypothetical protein